MIGIRRPSLYYLKYKLGLREAFSETSLPERACLRKYATGKKRLAEIGVLCGVNTKAFREVMDPDGILMAIDPYPRFFFGLRGFGWIRLIAHNEVNKVKNGKVIWVEEFGKDAPSNSEVAERLPADFLFVDGDHSWEGIEADYGSWKDNISPGGILALHDSINRNNCGVERFMTEVISKDPQFELVESVDSLSVMKKLTQ